jgi:hypothetical protein
MKGIASDLQTRLQRDPQAVVHLIVRTKDAPNIHLADAQACGLTVHRTFSLISALAVEGTASAALALANQPWVVSIEEDKIVHTM